MESVRKLLRDLNSKNLKERDEAEKSLIAMGPAALGFLPEVDANTSGEMKVRLQRIRQQMQSQNIETFFEFSKVTLSGKMKLTEAIKEITKQTENKITLGGEDALEDVEVELNEKDAPFWEVMDKIMQQAKLRVNTFATEEGLSLVPGMAERSSSQPNSFTTGPFRVDVASVQSTLPFNSRLGGQLDLSLMVSWEPRLKPVFVQIPMASLQATTNNEKVLTSASPDAAPEVPLNTGGSSAQIDLQLQRPDRSASKLSKLSGEFTFAVPGEKHKYVFKKFANGASQSEKFGDVEVTWKGHAATELCTRCGSWLNSETRKVPWTRFAVGFCRTKLTCLTQRTKTRERWPADLCGNSECRCIAYLFQINGNPDEFQLIYESPGVITQQTVKYELADIELP